MKKIIIDGEEYVNIKQINSNFELAKPKGKMKYVIVRTYSAGVFAGYLNKKKGKEVELINARRLWYWKGAASLSQLAMEGVKNPTECKFPCEVSKIFLTEAIEILEVTNIAKKSIDSVPVWKNE